MYALHDDIAALATLAGRSALNVVRVSGGRATFFFKRLTRTSKAPRPNYVYPKYIYTQKESEPFDYATLVYYKAPKSFTGEDSLEITVHGGVVIANRLIEALLSLGARLSEPGEFSYRAFINNKIDLLQAEAIASVVEASNVVDSYYLLGTIKGRLSEALALAKKTLEEIIVLGEYEIDFTEEEMTPGRKKNIKNKLVVCQQTIEAVIKSSYTERKRKAGARVVLIGLPNAGKSSMFNLLVGESRSIITKESGTTRDTVETEIYFGDILATLVDTAGIRKSKSRAEALGIQKTYEEIAGANIVVIIDEHDPRAIKKKLRARLKTQKVVLVHNKTDLKGVLKGDLDIFYTSCKTKTGIKKLITELFTLSKKEAFDFRAKYSYLINSRQKTLLKKIEAKLRLATLEYSNNLDLCVCLSNLYIIRQNFDFLIRPSEKDKVLNSIFKGFCIGK